MKMHPFKISISEPCHENWEKMTAVDQGKFCSSCAKKVIDFTHLSDEEIIKTIESAGKNLCGRLLTKQLDRPIYHPIQFSMDRRWSKIFGGLLLFSSVASALSYKLPDQHYLVPKKPYSDSVVQGDLNVISVRTVDKTTIMNCTLIDASTKLPIKNASIYLTSSSAQTSTNEYGQFSLSIPDSAVSDAMTFHVVAADRDYADFSVKKERLNLNNKIYLKEIQIAKMGMMMIEQRHED